MSWRVAKSLLHLRDQVNARFPVRNKENDGTIGDEAHASRVSDHNPWIQDGGVGVVSAMDITHDPAHGLDSYKMADQLKVSGDPRIKYVISNSRLWSPSISNQWRPYNGSNPHDHHVHISVKPEKANYDNVADWKIPMLGGVPPKLGPPGPPTPEASKELHEHITATEFGGSEDHQRSYYDNHVITDNEQGVALPYEFKGSRPHVNVYGPHGTSLNVPIVDVGPWNVNDPYWFEKNGRPQAESGRDHTGRKTNLAGIDLTPATAKLVGVDGKGLVNWEFADHRVNENVPLPLPPASAVRKDVAAIPVLPGSSFIANALRSLFGRKA